MFCRYCGNDIAGDSVFCEVCGKRLKEETVAPAPVFEETVQYDTNSPLYYYNNPTAQTNSSTSREFHASKYERMSGFSGSLPNEPHEPPQKIEYKRAPDEPIKPKKKKRGVVPYILLPVAVIVSSIISTISQLIGTNVFSAIVNESFIDSDFRYSFLYWSIYNLISSFTGVIPYVIAIVLFSLCCKGFYKKTLFVGSVYTGQIGGILASFFSVIIGYIILFTKGFYTFESQSIYTAVTSFSNIISCLIICPLIALLFFLWSQKYTVRKEEKTRPVKLVVPCVLMAIYSVLALGLVMLANLVLQPAFDELFNGDYTYNFASDVAHLITTGVSLVCLFLLALACKGGYRKVALIGSIKFATSICAVLLNFVIVIGTLINDSWYTGAVYIGQVIQYLCAIPVAIIIYILLNRYTVEKIKKKA